MRFSVIGFFVCLLLAAFSFPAFAAEKESAYDRVMRTGTIRCGYIQWPSVLDKDPNTGALSGAFYDFVEEIGKQLSLKILWAEEVNYATPFEGFSSGRYDVFCGPIAPTAARSREADFTSPFAYWPFYLYVREGDTRFDGKYEMANDPGVKLMGYDGDYSSIIAAQDFPKAQLVSIAQLADPAQALLEISGGRADAFATDPVMADRYISHNPGKVRRVPGPPLRSLPTTIALPPDEFRLWRMLDITVQDIAGTGGIEKILDKYPGLDKHLLRTALPYEVKK